MKAGSFWPSPSSVTTIGARAIATPVRIAADWPQDCSCRICRSQGRSAIKASSSASRRVRRTVVDIDDLEGAAGQGGFDLGDERRDIAGFVAHRHDDGHGRIGIAPVAHQHGGSF